MTDKVFCTMYLLLRASDGDNVLSFMSVCLSVRRIVVLYLNEGTYRQTFPPYGRGIFLGFLSLTAVTKFQTEHLP